MGRSRRFTTALALAAMVGTGMMFSSVSLEAKGKKNPGDGTICDALLAVITYPYVSDTIKAYATSLYLGYGCDPSLLP
jgi:hypothetical protein